ncbi:hypothetical protein TrST_g2569 [Triparma strigata]|uniref:Uncharacterized protein n=1 Tax=Triparma strigata TaxID=1606541 RepID=A0A9W7EZE6_9STRA|nr:hypothetical protein TrST_g2569 [Triparma strigata]
MGRERRGRERGKKVRDEYLFGDARQRSTDALAVVLFIATDVVLAKPGVANAEAASDTSSNIYRWMPPAAVQGDIARAMFYMDVRYNGDDDPDLKDLVLSDCPSKDDTKLGYLSELLRWHEADPVDSAEVARNSKVCEDYQGNRNPFVDHPEYVASIFGSAKDQSEYNCDESAVSVAQMAAGDGV